MEQDWDEARAQRAAVSGQAQSHELRTLIKKLCIFLPDVLSKNYRIQKFNLSLKSLIREMAEGKHPEFPQDVSEALTKKWNGSAGFTDFHSKVLAHLEKEASRLQRFSDDLSEQQQRQEDEYSHGVFGCASEQLLQMLVRNAAGGSEGMPTCPSAPGIFDSTLNVFEEIAHARSAFTQPENPENLADVPGVGAVPVSTLLSLTRILSNDLSELESSGLWDIWDMMQVRSVDPMSDGYDTKCQAICDFVETCMSGNTENLAFAASSQSSAGPSGMHTQGYSSQPNTRVDNDHLEVPGPVTSGVFPNFSGGAGLRSALPVGLVGNLGAMTTALADEALEAPSNPVQLDPSVVTLYIRNIPARFTPEGLMEEWPPQDSYNLLYMPYSHEHRRTVGCAIINFISNDAAVAFHAHWHGRSLVLDTASRKLDISVARSQGLENNLLGMKCSKKILRIKNPRYMPLVIQPDGTIADFRAVMESIQPSPGNIEVFDGNYGY